MAKSRKEAEAMSGIDPRRPIEEDPVLPTPAGDSQHKPWFRRRINAGLGWPQTWQAWLIAVGIVVVIVLIGLAVKGRL